MLLGEKLLSSALKNGNYRGVLDLTLGRDNDELFPHAIQFTDFSSMVHTLYLWRYNLWCGENSRTGFAKSF
jgi:hypothetical protein